MSFKIIKEYKKSGFIIIPEGFEMNGVYWMPPMSWSTKKRNNLLRNKFHLPDKALWEARPCRVKKNRIATYELAEEQEELLLQSNSNSSNRGVQDNVIVLRSDESSDDESESLLGKRPIYKSMQSPSDAYRPTRRRSTRNQSITQYGQGMNEDVKPQMTGMNDEIWNSFEITSSPSNFRSRVHTLQNSAIPPITQTHIPAINNCETSSSMHKMDKDASVDCDSECDSVGCNSMFEKSLSSKNLAKILKTLQQKQEGLARQINELKITIQGGLSTVLRELETLTQIQYSNSLSSVNPDVYPKKFCIENFKKVSTCEEANRLEKMLMIQEFKVDMVEKMSSIIGSKGTRVGEGWDCCYDLIETVFQRKFLKICSWTGASSSHMEDAKIAFLKYKNIISLFASVILNADPEFSFERTKDFFKNVLKSPSEFLGQSNREQCQTFADNAQNQALKAIKRKRQDEQTEKNELSKTEKAPKKDDCQGFEKLIENVNKVLQLPPVSNTADNEEYNEKLIEERIGGGKLDKAEAEVEKK